MSLPKILLTGFAALTLATPTFAQKTNCDTQLEGMLFFTNITDYFQVPTNTLKEDYTPEQFKCMSEGIKEKTDGKYQFIRYQNKETNETGYILEKVE